MASTKIEGSPRERLLAAADELFYAEGVHTVGIDRVIERAGVAKASLYSTFGSKEELVRAYLTSRHEARVQRVRDRLARHTQPRDQILSIFDLLGELAASPTFRGCAFINASAEGPREGKCRSVSQDSHAWLRDLFVRLSSELGARDPEVLGGQLMLLYDGATIAASLDRNQHGAMEARRTAEVLIDCQVKAKPAAKNTKLSKSR